MAGDGALMIDRSNHLLSSIPDAEWSLLRPMLRAVCFCDGDTVYHEARRVERLYFPNNGCIALVSRLSEDFLVETELVGAECVVGNPLIAGSQGRITSAIALSKCEALILRADTFRLLRTQLPGLVSAITRYVCSVRNDSVVHATSEGRCDLQSKMARYILTLANRLTIDELPLNQYVLASLLDTRRARISVIAGLWQQARIVQVSRGKITLINRSALERLCSGGFEEFHSGIDTLS